ncbi:hypothetical protein [Burkholderia gladioli]|uniref:hypothetical protein n=1 Tax=Burkholderia gladioli TaxID=28095 RepID=UPI001641DFAE|nr:hypothetical protein [Burkholderia gladioli]
MIVTAKLLSNRAIGASIGRVVDAMLDLDMRLLVLGVSADLGSGVAHGVRDRCAQEVQADFRGIEVRRPGVS